MGFILNRELCGCTKVFSIRVHVIRREFDLKDIPYLNVGSNFELSCFHTIASVNCYRARTFFANANKAHVARELNLELLTTEFHLQAHI